MKINIKNQVLNEKKQTSTNFYNSDLIFKEFLNRKISSEGFKYMNDKLENLGHQAATEMNELSLDADKNGPELIKRNFYGEDIDTIKFHPSYDRLLEIAVESEMFTVKWQPELRKKFEGETHRLGFTSGYLYALSESGQYCPLCMTDGVARLIDFYSEEEDKERLLPHIYTNNVKDLYTGAMFLTEKSGGSDVGRNLVKAVKKEAKYYALSGEKWFCSNVNAEIIFALARTNDEIEGTKGLSIFLVEKNTKDGKKNKLPIVRLKDKLGVRSMASAECVLDNTEGKLVGEEYNGFKIMTDMINLSRLYNSVAALSAGRRALVEAYQFLLFRESFGKFAIEHPLVREKLFELGSLNVANFYLTWRAIEALDKSDAGDENEKNLVRVLTPMVKKWSAEKSVYIARESMELMGGIGYIEDGVMPKIMRDAMVLPIWEGSGNIMILDMLRASFKSEGLPVMLKIIQKSLENAGDFKETMQASLSKLQKNAQTFQNTDKENLQLQAKIFFEELTNLFQLSLIVDNMTEANKAWMYPTATFLSQQLKKETNTKLYSVEAIKGLIGWEI